MDSIFIHSEKTPLNIIIVTDRKSWKAVAMFLGHYVMLQLSLQVIQSSHWRWRRVKGLPRLKISYVDAEKIIDKKRDFVKALKASTAQAHDHKTIDEDRYIADLFYMAPIYHLAFTNLKTMIVIDSTDLEFHDDISHLDTEMKKVKNGKLIGIGLDLSPNYYVQLEGYRRRNPGSQLGQAGGLQGFNTGVVLYNLAAMRQSALYNSYLSPKMVDQLSKKFLYEFTLAEQDWFTNLGYIHPHFFYVLSCKFNRQTSIQFLRPPWEDMFEKFHACEPKSNVVIFHSNGCGPTPQDCKFNPKNSSSIYWKERVRYKEDLHVDMNIFWLGLAGLE